MTMTLTLGDVLLLGTFVFQAGACYMLLRRHDQEIKDLRLSRHRHSNILVWVLEVLRHHTGESYEEGTKV